MSLTAKLTKGNNDFLPAILEKDEEKIVDEDALTIGTYNIR